MRGIEGKTVFITGAGGFLGSALVRSLEGSTASVRALLGPPGFAGAGAELGARTLCAEIDDLPALESLADGADIVIHLAGPPGVGASFDQAAHYARVHVAGTATVLEACRRTRVTRLVYISSAEVYGLPRTVPVAEDHPLEARSPYAAAKIGAERFVESFACAFGLDAVILRPFSIYGPGLSPASLIGTLLHQARSHEEIVVADTRPVRDYCYLDDVIEAILRACSVELTGPRIFNVGSGVGISVADLAALVLGLVDRDAIFQEDPRRRRPGSADILRLVADTGRAARDLGWQATTPLAEGLRRTIRGSETS